MLVIDKEAFDDFIKDITYLAEHSSILAHFADSNNSPEEASFYRGRASVYDALSVFFKDVADNHISIDEACGRLWATSISDR